MRDQILRIVRGAGIVLGLGVLFAWLGVYETGGIPFLPRALYWSATMAVGSLTGLWAVPFIRRTALPNQPLAIQLPVIAFITSVPVTALVAGLPVFGDEGGFHIADYVSQFGYVFVISMLITLCAFGLTMLGVIRWPGVDPPAPAPAAQPGAVSALSAAPAQAFLERLPVRLRTAELHAVESEDHYLRVHTSAGQELILMRLADAIRELASVEGLQTHRSWWVARAGVAEVMRANGRMTLKLKSGVEAPVSRTFAADVKAAGWETPVPAA
jgi:hypothetical protein